MQITIINGKNKIFNSAEIMTKEQYIQGIENFGKGQGTFSCKESVEKYPYFLIGRLLWTMGRKSEDKTVLAMLYPDRAKLSALLQTQKTAIQEDPISILQKRLHSIEEDKKNELKDNISEEWEPLFEPQPSVSLDELVEKFNNYPPSITPVYDDFDEEHLYRDMGKQSSMERMNIISETLADIYISQKLFDKAIKIYQELLLKYPEKSGIFANRIENLKNNIKQS